MRGSSTPVGADDRAAARSPARRTSSVRNTIRTAPRSCWPKPAIPNGFEVGMDCPNDRYVNDEAICQAVVGMLARVGVKVNLTGAAQGAVLRQGAEARRLPDLVLPARLDARHLRQPQRAVRHRGLPRRPEIVARRVQSRRLLQQEARRARRQGPGRDRQGQARPADQGGVRDRPSKDYGYIPLHQQALAWGVSKKVKLTQRADNSVLLYWATKGVSVGDRSRTRPSASGIIVHDCRRP